MNENDIPDFVKKYATSIDWEKGHLHVRLWGEVHDNEEVKEKQKAKKWLKDNGFEYWSNCWDWVFTPKASGECELDPKTCDFRSAPHFASGICRCLSTERNPNNNPDIHCKVPKNADDSDTTQPLLQCQCGFTTMLTDEMAKHIVDCMMAKSPKPDDTEGAG